MNEEQWKGWGGYVPIWPIPFDRLPTPPKPTEKQI